MNHLVLVLAVLCLGVSVFNVVLGTDTRALRQEFQQRQTTINEAAQYKQLNTQLISALANVAASSGDESIQQMLSSEGVTYTVNPVPETATESEDAGDSND